MGFNKRLKQLRALLKSTDYTLDPQVFEKATQLFFCHEDNPQILRKRVPEFVKIENQEKTKREFFLNIDNEGAGVCAPEKLVRKFMDIQQEHKDFCLWFQKAEYNSRQVLLVARWLCHFVGFRHRSCHIFLDHYTHQDYTFAQIRSFSKDDSPGFIDTVVGGHAKGVATIVETAKEELEGELNLDLCHDIEDYKEIRSYSYCKLERKDFHNIERRTVVWGRLKTDAMPKIEFRDGEVAAICMFTVSELKTLLKKVPERVAPGLTKSLGVYVKYKKKYNG